MAYKSKEDQAAASKRHYEANKDKIKSRTLKRNKKQNYKNREYIAFVKSLSECVDCGEDNTIVLEFDHVRGVKKITFPIWLINHILLELYKKRLISVK